jgi:large subunit ribosomal protein L25
MSSLILKAEPRKKTGGLSARKAVFGENRIPGIVYGGKDKPIPIFVKKNEFLKILNVDSVFNKLIELEVENKKELVVFKDIQMHPSKNIYTHFDLQRVVSGIKISVVVPVVLANQDKCYGVKIEGGIINHVSKEITVLADPNNIPEAIEVDMEHIKSKEKFRLGDLAETSNYEFASSLKTQDPVLVSVLSAKGGGLDIDDEDLDAVAGDESTDADSKDEASSDENNSEAAKEE